MHFNVDISKGTQLKEKEKKGQKNKEAAARKASLQTSENVSRDCVFIAVSRQTEELGLKGERTRREVT